MKALAAIVKPAVGYVFVALRIRVSRDGWCGDSYPSLAAKVGMTVRTLSDHVASLVSAGVVEERSEPRRGGPQGANRRYYRRPRPFDEWPVNVRALAGSGAEKSLPKLSSSSQETRPKVSPQEPACDDLRARKEPPPVQRRNPKTLQDDVDPYVQEALNVLRDGGFPEAADAEMLAAFVRHHPAVDLLGETERWSRKAANETPHDAARAFRGWLDCARDTRIARPIYCVEVGCPKRGYGAERKCMRHNPDAGGRSS